MITRDQVEAVLKINGVPTESPDEQIRSVLLSARFNKDEVDAALVVLRSNVKTNTSRVDGLHKCFHTNEALRPDEISELLGIEVDVTGTIATNEKKGSMSLFQTIMVLLLAIILAIISILIYMYLYKVGLFHPSIGLFR